jgi:hypothetical protein
MSAHASLSRQLNLLLSTRIPLFVICHVSTITRNIYTCLNLTMSNVWLTKIYSMVGGIPVGLVLGPLCEQYGARILITLLHVGGRGHSLFVYRSRHQSTWVSLLIVSLL